MDSAALRALPASALMKSLMVPGLSPGLAELLELIRVGRAPLLSGLPEPGRPDKPSRPGALPGTSAEVLPFELTLRTLAGACAGSIAAGERGLGTRFSDLSVERKSLRAQTRSESPETSVSATGYRDAGQAPLRPSRTTPSSVATGIKKSRPTEGDKVSERSKFDLLLRTRTGVTAACPTIETPSSTGVDLSPPGGAPSSAA